MEAKRKAMGMVVLLAGCLIFLGLHATQDQPVFSSPQLDSLPLHGRTIGVDPGHGGYDGGCVGGSGVAEKEYNLAVALKVGESLQALGAQVVYSRTEDIALIDPETTKGYKKRKELDNRLKIFDEAQVDAMVSIHMNKYKVPKYRGAQVFYDPDSEQGHVFADKMQQALCAIDEDNHRTASAGDYYILRACPAALLVECGFLSNPEEEKLLASEAYQWKLAEAVAQGVADYFIES